MNKKNFLRLFFKKKLLFSIIIGLILFISYVYFLKTPKVQKRTDLYVKIKLNQGLWWVTNAKPGIWFLDSLKKGEKEYDFLKKPIAEIISVRYYHQINFDLNQDLNQFDIYLLVKLSVDKINNRYIFKRSKIAVGAPIDLDFPSSQVTGTIISISTKPENELTEKIITLTKKYAFPWEYEAINIGDKYFDGEENVLEIIDKEAIDTFLLTTDYFGNINSQVQERRKYITVKAKIKLKKNLKNQLIFGEEQVVKKNAFANLTTDNYILMDFFVSDIE